MSVQLSSRFKSLILDGFGLNFIWRLCHSTRPQDRTSEYLTSRDKIITEEESREVDNESCSLVVKVGTFKQSSFITSKRTVLEMYEDIICVPVWNKLHSLDL